MNNAARSLADGLSGGEEIIQRFIDSYYASIRSEKDPKSLNAYCELFRKQMATWFIAPVILSKKITRDEELPRAIQSAYGSFGIAWRLLDDIQDVAIDMKNGIHSSIFICLSEDMQKRWHTQPANPLQDAAHRLDSVMGHILEKDIIGTLIERICSELKSAASIASDHHLDGLADEFNCLLRPLA
jgi:hypothetical protein